ncbi:hypothetical protein GLAREA_04186 [Glarea lozoyensis ATCC 20868]|uniref:Zn(2)-C6 fungal-type domain-containing protein n=1 Tax=Glarea lozoyensis (strain ATCC 20868 / MF5171) TaxID=1116229 RepID=S3CNU4_GLAL2|nr:uncharacterized protein GLAREA_04186 [Glarea lozoyensis ATCC 20868]EPE27395.1 hypothetical protein GLAREA_04186 [Glarea lozoyensis ATCC 20868]
MHQLDCDETKPACQKCLNGDFQCSYLDNQSSSREPSIHTPGSAAAVSSVADSTLWSAEPQGPFPGNLNMIHLKLLHHLETGGPLTTVIEADEEHPGDSMQETIRYALTNPYLMHEILSFSALHLSLVHPAERERWKLQSTELQTNALSLFNSMDDDSRADFVPCFLFASILGSHSMHDVLSSGSDELGPFLDRFVEYLQIVRGVRVLLTDSNWNSLWETPFRYLIPTGNRIPDPSTACAPELDVLASLLQTADISSSTMQVYQQVLNQLKSAFQSQAMIVDGPSKATAIHAIFAWPVLAPPEYANLLSRRQPESLTILAHYAVLLHYHRDVWLFGDGGRRLIESITRHLGAFWVPWLAWPISVLNS